MSSKFSNSKSPLSIYEASKSNDKGHFYYLMISYEYFVGRRGYKGNFSRWIEDPNMNTSFQIAYQVAYNKHNKTRKGINDRELDRNPFNNVEIKTYVDSIVSYMDIEYHFVAKPIEKINTKNIHFCFV